MKYRKVNTYNYDCCLDDKPLNMYFSYDNNKKLITIALSYREYSFSDKLIDTYNKLISGNLIRNIELDENNIIAKVFIQVNSAIPYSNHLEYIKYIRKFTSDYTKNISDMANIYTITEIQFADHVNNIIKIGYMKDMYEQDLLYGILTNFKIISNMINETDNVIPFITYQHALSANEDRTLFNISRYIKKFSKVGLTSIYDYCSRQENNDTKDYLSFIYTNDASILPLMTFYRHEYRESNDKLDKISNIITNSDLK